MLVTCLLQAGLVASLALVQSSLWCVPSVRHLPLPSALPNQGCLPRRGLYSIVVLQFTCAAFYEPARKALIPLTVEQHELQMAATIDSATCARRPAPACTWAAHASTWLMLSWLHASGRLPECPGRGACQSCLVRARVPGGVCGGGHRWPGSLPAGAGGLLHH